MTPLILLLQQTNIEEKLKNSPDSGYQIGVLIGSFLPIVLLAGAAWCLRETLVGLARRRPLADIVGDGLLHALLLVLLLKLFWILAIDPLRLGRPQ